MLVNLRLPTLSNVAVLLLSPIATNSYPFHLPHSYVALEVSESSSETKIATLYIHSIPVAERFVEPPRIFRERTEKGYHELKLE